MLSEETPTSESPAMVKPSMLFSESEIESWGLAGMYLASRQYKAAALALQQAKERGDRVDLIWNALGLISPLRRPDPLPSLKEFLSEAV